MLLRITLLLTLAALWAAPAAADSLTISDMAFGTGIENHAVTGVETTFSLDQGRIYCWTVVQGAGQEDTIYHTWYLGETFVQKVPLVVRGAHWRTYSYKTLDSSHAGVWKVEVTNQSGTVLAEDEVMVESGGMPDVKPMAKPDTSGAGSEADGMPDAKPMAKPDTSGAGTEDENRP